MSRLGTQQRARIVACLLQDKSIRLMCRMTGPTKDTGTKLLVDLGRACSEDRHATLRTPPRKRIRCDEI